MKISDNRTLLHKEIDLLNDQNLAKVLGVIRNIKSENKDDNIWLDTSKSELNQILEGLTDIENGKTIPHNLVMIKMRKKVANAN
jgi:hypothetical protein